jgi:hypothetical protein
MGSTKSLTGMSTRNHPGGEVQSAHKGLYRKYGNRGVEQPHGNPRPITETAVIVLTSIIRMHQ